MKIKGKNTVMDIKLQNSLHRKISSNLEYQLHNLSLFYIESQLSLQLSTQLFWTMDVRLIK